MILDDQEAEKPAGNKPKTTKSSQSKPKTGESDSSAKSTSMDGPIQTVDTDNSNGNKPSGNGNGSSKTQTTGKQPLRSEARLDAIYNLSRRQGISVEDLEQMSADTYGCRLKT